MTYKLKPITYCLIALIIALGSNIFASPEDEYKKAVSLYESGKYSEAKSAFEDCISNYPDSSFVPNSLLYLAKMEKDHEKMANYCRKIVQEYPNSNVADDALFEIGKSSMKRGLYSDAETQFKFLLDKYPTSNLIEDTYYQLGLLLIEMMDYDSAINYFNKVINDFPNSPNKSSAQFGIANAYFGKMDYNSAIKEYDKIISSSADINIISLAMFRKGECYEKMNKTDEAKLTYQKVVSDYPQTDGAKKAQEKLSGPTTTKDTTKPPTETNPTNPETTKTSKGTSEPTYTIQVASCKEQKYALDLKSKLEKWGYAPVNITNAVVKGEVWYRIRVGSYSSKESAQKDAKALEKKLNKKDLWITKE